MSWRRSRVLAVAGALLAGCGGGDGEPSAVTVAETTPTSTTTTEATTTTVSAEAAVEQAFYEQWDAFIEILSDPDPANPLIDRYFTGPARESLLDAISRFVSDGVSAKRPDDRAQFQPTVRAVHLESRTRAVVIECTIDGIQQVDRRTGTVIDSDVAQVHGKLVFEYSGGQWRVAEIGTASAEDPPCDF